MKKMLIFKILVLGALSMSFSTAAEEGMAKAGVQFYEGKPVKVLLVTGGCCHDYEYQTKLLKMSSEARADLEWTIIHKGGNGTKAQIDLYDDADWAKPYDVVVHNECFADTSDPEYIKKITDAHAKGKPGVVIHCAMHTYRDTKIDDWRDFLGVTSRHHEHQSRYEVTTVAKDHPIMKGFPADWKTPKDELYVILDQSKEMIPLATSKSEKDGKTYPVIWVNSFHGTRVFGTTYGHSNETFTDPVFLDLVTRGILWSAGKLEEKK